MSGSFAESARARKVSRFCAAFDSTVRDAGRISTDSATAREIVRQLSAATQEQWAQLAEQMHEPKAPSPTTQRLILAHYQYLANQAYAVGESVTSRHYAQEQDGVRVVAGADQYGFTWSVYASGVFVRSGYTRSLDVEKAFADARASLDERAAGGR